MIINISAKRRLLRYRYGWQIQCYKHIKPKKGEKFYMWKEESPAYPSTLIRGLQMCLEREISDANPEIDIQELAEAIKKAEQAFKTAKVNMGKL